MPLEPDNSLPKEKKGELDFFKFFEIRNPKINFFEKIWPTYC